MTPVDLNTLALWLTDVAIIEGRGLTRDETCRLADALLEDARREEDRIARLPSRPKLHLVTGGRSS